MYGQGFGQLASSADPYAKRGEVKLLMHLKHLHVMFKNTTPISCPEQLLCASGTVWLVKRFALALKPIRARCPSLGSMHSYFPIVFINSSWPQTTEVLKCYLIFKSGSDHTYPYICMLDISGHLILNRSSKNMPIPARQEVASLEWTCPPDVDVLRFLQR